MYLVQTNHAQDGIVGTTPEILPWEATGRRRAPVAGADRVK
jgi:hypothetical protein